MIINVTWAKLLRGHETCERLLRRTDELHRSKTISRNSQLSQRNRAARWVSYGQKWKM